MLATTRVLGAASEFGGDGRHMGGGAGAALMLVPLVIAGLIAFGIWSMAKARRESDNLAVASAAAPSFVASQPDDGLAPSIRTLLDERFARGEIDSETYLHQVATFRLAYEAPTVTVDADTTDTGTTDPDTTEMPQV